MFRLGTRSLERLIGVDARLVAVVKRALELSPIDFMVLEGKRTLQRQQELFDQGRKTPGKIVTWTMKSKHLDGLAVDLVPFPVDWNDTRKFDQIAKAMFAAADELGVKVRWGADWDMDGNYREKGEYDSPHFEIS